MTEMRLLSRTQIAGMSIHSSPSLQPQEKETCFSLLGGGKEIAVMSYHPTAIRGFLRQPEFLPTKTYVEQIDGRDIVVGIEGVLPLGCLHIGAARKRDFLSTVFGRRSGMKNLPDCVSGTQAHRSHSSNDDRGTSDEPQGRRGDSSTSNCVGKIQ